LSYTSILRVPNLVFFPIRRNKGIFNFEKILSFLKKYFVRSIHSSLLFIEIVIE